MLELYGHYELIERLATGGMAELFRARQLGVRGFEKELVIKRILPSLAADVTFVRMFLDEARIAARLNHPNIAQIYNLGLQGGTYFIAMEFIDGKDLREVWKCCALRGVPMPQQHAARVVSEAAAALHHAHGRTNKKGQPLGIVHRDVSPQNILITTAGDIKVIDFGIAKAADSSEQTRAGILKGKLAYMAPEQAAGHRVDRRADIFALGVVLHELLTGQRLFKRETEASTLTAVGKCQVDAPSSLRPELDPGLDAIVLKALAKSTRHRYQTAEELQLALEQWLLSRKLPSGPAHLAQFLASLSTAAATEPSPRSVTPAPPAPPAANPALTRADGDATRLLHDTQVDKKSEPSLPAPRRTEPPASLLGDMSRRQVGVFAFLLGVSVVAIALLVGLMASGPKAPSVRVSSQPAGASVVWNGVKVPAVTPCVLPDTPPGSYRLEVSFPGYEPYRAQATMPDRGALELSVVLRPLLR